MAGKNSTLEAVLPTSCTARSILLLLERRERDEGQWAHIWVPYLLDSQPLVSCGTYQPQFLHWYEYLYKNSVYLTVLFEDLNEITQAHAH